MVHGYVFLGRKVGVNACLTLVLFFRLALCLPDPLFPIDPYLVSLCSRGNDVRIYFALLVRLFSRLFS